MRDQQTELSQFDRFNTKINESTAKRLNLEEAISNQKTKGVTIDEKVANLGIGALQDIQKVLQAEEALTLAKAQQAALTDTADAAAVAAAQAAVDAAEVGVVVAKKLQAVNAENREIQRETTQFQKTLNELKNKELIATRAINSERAGLSRLEAGIGKQFGFEAARSIAIAREDVARQVLSGAKAQQNTAQSRFNQAQKMFDNEQIDMLEKVKSIEAKRLSKMPMIQNLVHTSIFCSRFNIFQYIIFAHYFSTYTTSRPNFWPCLCLVEILF